MIKLPKTSGVIAIVFLILGYQIALFVHKASVLKLVAHRDKPDTIYVVETQAVDSFLTRMQQEDLQKLSATGNRVEIRKNAEHKNIRYTKKVENFTFNPNTASSSDLQRLGFSEKQAQSIINYREKGGRFRRKEDFRKSFVVADSVYHRLEPFILIPKIDINTADTTQLISLPGIGSWYAKRIIEYREELQGYSYPEQLMDLWKFDQEKYDKLSDLIVCSKNKSYPLWELPEEELKLHPYIKWSAHGIVVFRKNNPKEDWTIDNLIKNNIIKEEYGDKLKRCNIGQP